MTLILLNNRPVINVSSDLSRRSCWVYLGGCLESRNIINNNIDILNDTPD